MKTDFPTSISFTITNACNLRCKMCGQWSEEGYIRKDKNVFRQLLILDDWKRLVDELAAHKISSLLIRGGEPFLFPGIIELLEYINSKDIFISIDTNGTLLKKYAADLLRIGKVHITVSIDGPEDIHDKVRGVKGCFRKIEEGLILLSELEKNSDSKISKALCFTISPYSVNGLGEMPNVARRLLVNSIVIVPYYYFPTEMGKIYETELKKYFNCKAYSWHGFHHEYSGVNFDIFKEEFKKYKDNLNGINNYPYMVLSEEEYKIWFEDATKPVGSFICSNVEKLLDIQPTGEANFCVDFPDYSIGNVTQSTIEELWNSEKAEKFREYRRKNLLAVCYRCGAKFMSEIES
jgi:radical SAM protein with 4Fe4S-binding SPASM domain